LTSELTAHYLGIGLNGRPKLDYRELNGRPTLDYRELNGRPRLERALYPVVYRLLSTCLVLVRVNDHS